VIADPGIDRGGVGEGEVRVEEAVRAKVDIEEFALDRPAVTECVFGADAGRPAPDVLGGRVEEGRGAAQPLGFLDARPGAAAGDVPEPLVGHSVAQSCARRAEPGLMDLIDVERAEGWQQEVLAILIGHATVDLDAPYPVVDLVVTPDGAASEE